MPVVLCRQGLPIQQPFSGSCTSLCSVGPWGASGNGAMNFSHVSGVQEAWGFSGRWKPTHDDRHDPGWMMPLVVLSKVYTTYLSTFGDDYMYHLQKPLPLSELYSPRRNEGLISLLKYGLWQVSISPNHMSAMSSGMLTTVGLDV